MLLRYIVSNFKSIGHPVEFSMFPTEESTDERFLKTITTKAGEWKVLRRGGFFGPNASGKSSFIESIDFAGIISLMDRKAEKERVSTSLEVILKISRESLPSSSCFTLKAKFMSMAFLWIDARCMKNG